MWKITVNSQSIDISADDFFIRGSVGVKINVILTEYWNDYITTLVFHRQNRQPINIILQKSDNIITVPYEILTESGTFKIGAFGIKNDIISPTLWSQDIPVLHGTDTKGAEPTEYTPSEMEQIKSQINNKQDVLTAGENITITKDNVISATGGSGSTVSEKWEKIVDFTVAEDCMQVKIDKDLSGNDFSLKKAYIKTKMLPASENTNKILIKVSTDKSITNVWNDGFFHLSNCPDNTSNYSRAYAMLEKVDNEVVLIENRISGSYTNVADTLCAYGGSYNLLSILNNKPHDVINCLFLGSYQAVVGAGSTLEMWGVRE